MSLSSSANAVYSAALSVADGVDPAGRLRAVLHLLRMTGGTSAEEILHLRLERLISPDGTPGICGQREPSQFDPKRLPHGSVLIGSRAVPLDAGVAEELSTYLTRRSRFTTVRFFQKTRGKGVWGVQLICGGGVVTRSLRTTDEVEARQRLRGARRSLVRRARARDNGWLFPRTYVPHRPVSLGQFRQWINLAVGRQSDPETRRAADEERPAFRVQARRPRD